MTGADGPDLSRSGCRDPRARTALESYWRAWGPAADQRGYLVFQSRRFDAVLETAAALNMTSTTRVLDVGAGSGGVSVALHARFGGEFHLADYLAPSETALAALRQHGVTRYLRCDLSSKTPFSEIQPGYDVVLFVEVLEHLLVNPIVLVRALGALLRPGGHLILTTPNQARLRNRFHLLRGHSIREPGAFSATDSPTHGHVQEYTPDELRGYVGQAGLVTRSLRVVQNLPSLNPSAGTRAGARITNSGLGRRLWWGDEIILLAQRPL